MSATADCRNKVTYQFWVVGLSTAPAVLTFIVNGVAYWVLLTSEQLKTIFHRLVFVFIIAENIRWFISFFQYKFLYLDSSCYLVDFLLDNSPIHIIFVLPRAFLLFLSLVICISLALSRLTAVLIPLESKEIWNDNAKKIYFMVLTMSFLLTIPLFFTHTMLDNARTDGKKALGYQFNFRETFSLSYELYHAIISIFAALIIVAITLVTVAFLARNRHIGKYVQSSSILCFGLALSGYSCINAFSYFVYYLAIDLDIEWAMRMSENYWYFYGISDFLQLSPVYIVIFCEPRFRRILTSKLFKD